MAGSVPTLSRVPPVPVAVPGTVTGTLTAQALPLVVTVTETIDLPSSE